MKKILILAAFLPGAAFACADLSAYSVERLDFQQLPADQAISKTLKGTPFQVSYIGAPPTKQVNANGVSGTLDRVLPELSRQVGLVYTQTGCTLSFLPRENRVFSLAPGDMIHVRLSAWLEKNGYTLFWEAGKYQAGAAMTMDKPLEDTLKEVVSFMEGNGAKLAVEIYGNRMVRVMEVK